MCFWSWQVRCLSICFSTSPSFWFDPVSLLCHFFYYSSCLGFVAKLRNMPKSANLPNCANYDLDKTSFLEIYQSPAISHNGNSFTMKFDGCWQVYVNTDSPMLWKFLGLNMLPSVFFSTCLPPCFPFPTISFSAVYIARGKPFSDRGKKVEVADLWIW